MSSNRKYECPHCDHSCFQRHFVKHIITYHLDVLQNNYISEAKNAYNHKKGIKFHIKDEEIIACLGCNKFWARKSLADNHFEKCPNKNQHLEGCKSIFEPLVGIDDTSVLIKQLQEQNQELKKQIELKNKIIAKYQQKANLIENYHKRINIYNNIVGHICEEFKKLISTISD